MSATILVLAQLASLVLAIFGTILISSLNSATPSLVQTRTLAFKEAWAEFIAREVFKDSKGCNKTNFDLNNASTFDKMVSDDEMMRLLVLTDSERERLSELTDKQRSAANGENFPNFGAILAPYSVGKCYRYNILKFLCDLSDRTPMANSSNKTLTKSTKRTVKELAVPLQNLGAMDTIRIKGASKYLRF